MSTSYGDDLHSYPFLPHTKCNVPTPTCDSVDLEALGGFFCFFALPAELFELGTLGVTAPVPFFCL